MFFAIAVLIFGICYNELVTQKPAGWKNIWIIGMSINLAITLLLFVFYPFKKKAD
jgi:hypothetical protein